MQRGGASLGAGPRAEGRGVHLGTGRAWLPLTAVRPQVLGLCGAAYRPTEEIDLRSVGWGNIFQLPFKHVRDFRLRHLVPFFVYSGFEVLFACTGLALVGAARGGGDRCAAPSEPQINDDDGALCVQTCPISPRCPSFLPLSLGHMLPLKGGGSLPGGHG